MTILGTLTRKITTILGATKTKSLLYSLADGSLRPLPDDAAIASNKTLAQQLQARLQDFWLLTAPDGLWGPKSSRALDAYKRFRKINEPGIGKQTATSLINTQAKDLIPGFKLNGDWASRTILWMVYHDLHISTNGKAGEINIVYFRGLDRSGAWNGNKPFVFNDRRCILKVQDGVPSFAGNWLATCDPGEYFWDKPENPAGCADIKAWQFQSWSVGTHYGSSTQQYPTLVQADDIIVLRGPDRIPDKGSNFGVDQHTVGDGEDYSPGDAIGPWSAGCMVGASAYEHYNEFMPIVQADPREKASPKQYHHWTTVINGNDFLDLFPKG